MLMDMLMFAAGASAALGLALLCDDYVRNRHVDGVIVFRMVCDDKTCIERKIHLLKQEPLVDMVWFNETLTWSEEFKKETIQRHRALKFRPPSEDQQP
jgi:hypothetical protein